jgi:hypothetical protein
MGVRYSSPDSPFTRITVVYRCRCGALASEVGRHAADLPPGWERVDEETCLCAYCAEHERAKRATAARPA